MAGFLPPVVATLLADISEFKDSMEEAQGEMAETDEAGDDLGKGLAFGVVAAIIGVGVAAVEMGSKFQSTMELLHTQAGVPQSAIAGLSQGVLQLAGQVGFSPDSLAEALYHIESSFASVGITGPKALSLLQVAAEGAAVGHADLVDVTNALDAAVVSGIPGVQNFTQAMGALNAVVGSGDMTMQDLADAMSTGVLAVVKGYGLSLNDVGAALATFGDNNIRGAVAATDLRMAVQAMQTPVSTAGPIMAKLGINANTLADVMQKGGLLPALQLLNSRMNAVGLGGVKMSQTLTDLVGKKAGSGLDVLIGQLSRVESKYPALEAGANDFGNAWAATKATFSQTMKEVEATFEALITELGLKLMPILTRVANWFLGSVAWLEHHKSVLEALAVVAGGALVYALYSLVAATIAWTTALDVNPVFLIIEAIAALAAGVYYAYTHFTTFRNIVDEVGRDFKAVWADAVAGAGAVVYWFTNTVLPWLKARLADVEAWWRQHGQEVMQLAKEMWVTLQTIFKVAMTVIVGALRIWLDVSRDLWGFFWTVLKGTVVTAWDFIRDVFMMAFHMIVNTFDIFLDVMTGHWSQAWSDLKKLVTQGFADVEKVFGDFEHNALTYLFQAGKDLIQGLINGISDMTGDAEHAVENVGDDIVHGFKSLLGIGSPSKVFYGHGQDIVNGLVLGISSQQGAARNAIRQLAAATTVGSPALGISAAGMGGGIGSGSSGITVEIYLDGQKIQGAVRKQTLRYDQRNGSNGLALAGRS